MLGLKKKKTFFEKVVGGIGVLADVAIKTVEISHENGRKAERQKIENHGALRKEILLLERQICDLKLEQCNSYSFIKKDRLQQEIKVKEATVERLRKML